MGATSAADNKSTSITVAAIAATLSITIIALALVLWRWREAAEKRKTQAALEAGIPVFEQNGFRFQRGGLKDPAEFDLEQGALGSSGRMEEPTIPLVEVRPPVPALIRTPATGSF